MKIYEHELQIIDLQKTNLEKATFITGLILFYCNSILAFFAMYNHEILNGWLYSYHDAIWFLVLSVILIDILLGYMESKKRFQTFTLIISSLYFIGMILARDIYFGYDARESGFVLSILIICLNLISFYKNIVSFRNCKNEDYSKIKSPINPKDAAGIR